ncbi:hypothetical protein DL769_005770 [Monosporascus sp. CRB-8-3]|nr:hypothetical protein DL769_005770 [Monosporascus sp. CRB-8-3]
MVRTLLAFAELAENGVVHPSVDSYRFTTHDFFPYADENVFPRLSVVMVMVQELELDDSGLSPSANEPWPKWSLRLLDAYTPTSRSSKSLAEKRNARWDAKEPQGRAGGLNCARPQDMLSKFDTANM